jgi:hypothetical protein
MLPVVNEMGETRCNEESCESLRRVEARIKILEYQHGQLIDQNAQLIAEVRNTRGDSRAFHSAVSSELTRLYNLILMIAKKRS